MLRGGGRRQPAVSTIREVRFNLVSYDGTSKIHDYENTKSPITPFLAVMIIEIILYSQDTCRLYNNVYVLAL